MGLIATMQLRFYEIHKCIAPGLMSGECGDIDSIIAQYDPFNAECRAYGRLKEAGREDLAIRCFGYILLTSDQEALIERGDNRWNRRPENKGKPLRCILKEYINPDVPPFIYDMIPMMRANIINLNKLGVIAFDLRKGNYMNGKIVDFSQAHTVPHIELDWISSWNPQSRITELCAKDYICFDDMIDEWNEEHPDQFVWKRFIPSRFFGIRLRQTNRYRLPGRKERVQELMQQTMIGDGSSQAPRRIKIQRRNPVLINKARLSSERSCNSSGFKTIIYDTFKGLLTVKYLYY